MYFYFFSLFIKILCLNGDILETTIDNLEKIFKQKKEMNKKIIKNYKYNQVIMVSYDTSYIQSNEIKKLLNFIIVSYTVLTENLFVFLFKPKDHVNFDLILFLEEIYIQYKKEKLKYKVQKNYKMNSLNNEIDIKITNLTSENRKSFILNNQNLFKEKDNFRKKFTNMKEKHLYIYKTIKNETKNKECTKNNNLTSHIIKRRSNKIQKHNLKKKLTANVNFNLNNNFNDKNEKNFNNLTDVTKIHFAANFMEELNRIKIIGIENCLSSDFTLFDTDTNENNDSEILFIEIYKHLKKRSLFEKNIIIHLEFNDKVNTKEFLFLYDLYLNSLEFYELMHTKKLYITHFQMFENYINNDGFLNYLKRKIDLNFDFSEKYYIKTLNDTATYHLFDHQNYVFLNLAIIESFTGGFFPSDIDETYEMYVKNTYQLSLLNRKVEIFMCLYLKSKIGYDENKKYHFLIIYVVDNNLKELKIFSDYSYLFDFKRLSKFNNTYLDFKIKQKVNNIKCFLQKIRFLNNISVFEIEEKNLIEYFY